MGKKDADRIVKAVAEKFQCFGGNGRMIHGNPLSEWWHGKPPQFALGVDVREVVEFVLKEAKRKPKAPTGRTARG